MDFLPGGNKRFRDAVTASLDQYMKAETRFEKSLVVHSIIDSIHQLGGRFLKKDFDSSLWFEMSRQQCKEKVGHAIRDAVNSYEARRKKKQQATPARPRHLPPVSSSQLATPAVRMSIAGLSSSGAIAGLKRRLSSPPLTVETDYGESARKRRRSERHQEQPCNAPSSIMRSAAPLKPSPITSGIPLQSPEQQPKLTYSSETSGSYPVQAPPHFSFDNIPIRQQRDDFSSTHHSRIQPSSAVGHDPEAPHADHFELAIEAVLGPMPLGEDDDEEDGV